MRRTGPIVAGLFAAGLLSAVLALTACGAPEAESTPTPTPSLDPSWTQTASASPTPTPTPTPTELPGDVQADIAASLDILKAAAPQAQLLYNATVDYVDDPRPRDALQRYITQGNQVIGRAAGYTTMGLADLIRLREDIEAVLVGLRENYNPTIASIKVTVSADGSNGRLDPSTLCSVPYDTQQLLLCGAVDDWMALNAEFKAQFGTDIPIDVSYRTYDQQVVFKQVYGGVAAAPGHSNHGWGRALDLPDWRPALNQPLGAEYNYGSPKREWIATNGPAHHWDCNRISGEPWHCEWTG